MEHTSQQALVSLVHEDDEHLLHELEVLVLLAVTLLHHWDHLASQLESVHTVHGVGHDKCEQQCVPQLVHPPACIPDGEPPPHLDLRPHRLAVEVSHNVPNLLHRRPLNTMVLRDVLHHELEDRVGGLAGANEDVQCLLHLLHELPAPPRCTPPPVDQQMLEDRRQHSWCGLQGICEQVRQPVEGVPMPHDSELLGGSQPLIQRPAC